MSPPTARAVALMMSMARLQRSSTVTRRSSSASRVRGAEAFVAGAFGASLVLLITVGSLPGKLVMGHAPGAFTAHAGAPHRYSKSSIFTPSAFASVWTICTAGRPLVPASN
jgi:hypothetical protein